MAINFKINEEHLEEMQSIMEARFGERERLIQSKERSMNAVVGITRLAIAFIRDSNPNLAMEMARDLEEAGYKV